MGAEVSRNSSGISRAPASAAAASRVAGPLFSLLASPARAAALRGVSSGMATCPHTVSESVGLVDATCPSLAPLLRAAALNDPALEGIAASLIGSRYCDAHSFWSVYFARVEALAEELNAGDGATATAIPAAASPSVLAGRVSPAPSAAASTPTSAAVDASPPLEAAPTAAAPPPAREAAAAPRAALSAGAAAASEEEEDELLLLTLPEVFVYKLAPRGAASGYTAASWGLDRPLLTCYARLVGHGEAELSLALWQRGDASAAAPAPTALAAAAARFSTQPGALGHKLVAACRLPLLPPATARAALARAPPAAAAEPHLLLLAEPLAYYLEPAVDSSRYFAVRVVQAGRSAVLGIGFRDRRASFDLRSAIDDYLQLVARQRGMVAAPPPPQQQQQQLLLLQQVGMSGGGDDAPLHATAAGASVLARTGAAAVAATTPEIGPLAAGSKLILGSLALKAADGAPVAARSAGAGAAAAAAPASAAPLKLAAPRAFAAPVTEQRMEQRKEEDWGDFATAET